MLFSHGQVEIQLEEHLNLKAWMDRITIIPEVEELETRFNAQAKKLI